MNRIPHVLPFNAITFKLFACLVVMMIGTLTPAMVSAASPADTFLDHTGDARDVVNKLVAEDYEGIRKNFNETMRNGLSAEKMREVWRSVIEHVGAFRSQGDPQTQNNQGWEIIVIPCQMERGRINVEVDYDPNGKIGGLWVRPAQ